MLAFVATALPLLVLSALAGEAREASNAPTRTPAAPPAAAGMARSQPAPDQRAQQRRGRHRQRRQREAVRQCWLEEQWATRRWAWQEQQQPQALEQHGGPPPAAKGEAEAAAWARAGEQRRLGRRARPAPRPDWDCWVLRAASAGHALLAVWALSGCAWVAADLAVDVLF
eukprot:scaffold5.g977.t1